MQAREVKADPFQVSFHYNGELAGNFSGGFNPFRVYYGNVSLGIYFHTQKAGLWKGREFLLQGLHVHGANPSATCVPDLQTISRIEACERTALFQCWFRQTCGRFSVLLGQHDMNAAFAAHPYAGKLISTSCGILPVKHSIRVYPSIRLVYPA